MSQIIMELVTMDNDEGWDNPEDEYEELGGI